MKPLCFAICLTVLCSMSASVTAQEKLAGLARWNEEIQKFEAADKAITPIAGGVLFYGSSSARLWDLPKSFPKLKTINRGFGGSDMEAAAHFYERVVPAHQPRIVVLYEGDNDLQAGRTAEQILTGFESLVGKHKSALPNSQLICLSIKYSPKRVKLRRQQEDTNAMLKSRCAKDPQLLYLDVATTLLAADGQPDPRYFQEDMLHLNLAGYAAWNTILLPVLESTRAAPASQP